MPTISQLVRKGRKVIVDIYCILYFYSNAAAVLTGGTVHTQRLGTLGLKSAGSGSGEGV